MSLLHLTVRGRLALGFGLVILLLVGVTLTSLAQLASFNQKVEALASVRLVQLVSTAQAANFVALDIRSIGNVLVLDDEKQVKEELTSVHNNAGALRELLAKIEKAISGTRERELFTAIGTALQAYGPHEQKFLEAAGHGDYSSAKDLMLQGVRPAQVKLTEALEQFEAHQVAVSADEARQASEAYLLTRGIIVSLAAVAVLAAVALSWAITRSIIRPIGTAVSVAQRVAAGDLSVELQAEGRDEMAQLLRALAGMASNLRQLVGEVAGGAHVVADSSAQIARGNGDLSQRTEEQASTLEETASSLEELTSTVTQNAENARNATRFAAGAAEVATRGGKVVGEVVRTMNDISDASRKISEIIGVIDGIAFQTNILALNAAVEAARAGDQGRGFAVVAAEVRNLAQRSAAAAKEIKTLIGDSVGKVEAGSKMVDSAGQTMEEVVASVRKVSELIAEIAAAGQEQSSGIEQVNKAVAQMDEAVQQNASLVEESAAATESMKNQADGLLQTVSRFRLREGDTLSLADAPQAGAAEAGSLSTTIAPIRVRRPSTAAAAMEPAWQRRPLSPPA